jgi:hypothetical protein
VFLDISISLVFLDTSIGSVFIISFMFTSFRYFYWFSVSYFFSVHTVFRYFYWFSVLDISVGSVFLGTPISLVVLDNFNWFNDSQS